MGLEYCLFKPDTNERYELGKGEGWNHIFPKTTNLKRNPFTLKAVIGGGYIDLYGTMFHREFYQKLVYKLCRDFDESVPLGYFKKLSEDIINWCGYQTIEFWCEDYGFNESFDPKFMTPEEFQNKYPYTGSRFNIEYGPENKRSNEMDKAKINIEGTFDVRTVCNNCKGDLNSGVMNNNGSLIEISVDPSSCFCSGNKEMFKDAFNRTWSQEAICNRLQALVFRMWDNFFSLQEPTFSPGSTIPILLEQLDNMLTELSKVDKIEEGKKRDLKDEGEDEDEESESCLEEGGFLEPQESPIKRGEYHCAIGIGGGGVEQIEELIRKLTASSRKINQNLELVPSLSHNIWDKMIDDEEFITYCFAKLSEKEFNFQKGGPKEQLDVEIVYNFDSEYNDIDFYIMIDRKTIFTMLTSFKKEHETDIEAKVQELSKVALDCGDNKIKDELGAVISKIT